VHIVCLDLEGVLIPEIWVEFAKKSGIAALNRTTRDEPDYDKLMRFRLDTLAEHGMKLADLDAVVETMSPLPGAREFLDELRTRYQVVILSDTFYEFVRPLMKQLGWPTLFCHRLQVDDAGAVTGYRLRMPDQKRAAVQAFQGLNFCVVAVGDSYNDTSMLGMADVGFFLHAPEQIAHQFPDFRAHHDYDALLESIDRVAKGFP
jgi:phosphoserine/homoserine phosphotransferase